MIGITDVQREALERLAPDLEHETCDFEPDRLEEKLAAAHADLRVTGRARGTLHLEIGATPTRILSYRYSLLDPPEARPGLAVPVASQKDLVCMKVSAIAGRGAAKDFWDLHVMLEHGVLAGDLATALEAYARKYPVEDIGHAVRSLAYFGDADAAPLPPGLSAAEWAITKEAFARRVRAL